MKNKHIVFLKHFGFSVSTLKTYHDREWCFGFNFQSDKIVHLGLVVYFHRKVIGAWWLK